MPGAHSNLLMRNLSLGEGQGYSLAMASLQRMSYLIMDSFQGGVFLAPFRNSTYFFSLKAQAPSSPKGPLLSGLPRAIFESAEGPGTFLSPILWSVYIFIRARACNQDAVASFHFPFVYLSTILMTGLLCPSHLHGLTSPLRGEAKEGVS